MKFSMDDNTAIIGTSRGSKRFEAKSRQGSATSVAYFENTHPKCEGNTCICLCKNIGYETVNFETKIKCEQIYDCNAFDDIQFLKIRPLTDFEAPQPYPGLKRLDYWWENGFIILTQTKFENDRTLLATIGFGGLQEQMKNKEKTIYLQRYKDYVNVCYSQNCITSEVKNQISSSEAIESFKLFVKAYEDCKLKINGECGIFNLKIPAMHYIYYIDSKSGRNGFYLVRGNYPRIIREMEIVRNADGSETFSPGALFKEDNAEFPTGNIFEGYESELKVKDSKVTLSITTGIKNYLE
ncbi:hypothetical protein HYY71_04290 [Candidatus Woesearchaeota archaeon]|nr:hypothetical protein [Candidatus Woesearchaeota archaeon]